ncbi:hypothetical protein [Granulosicoccus antarcticus]|uniref:Uncharacterized protein n=1 Tax=Granulosicoccus antarcticus IMCC3135 TaxID=1192854 RepID=A0A2Z2NSW4_9GAMM|nr:hypothetical protein [Granulosicoccus antarcticus]ASJ72828.1 hypothetical protein IMCC3135_13715 [Granulosicoccus antarcticus IMCC3135]
MPLYDPPKQWRPFYHRCGKLPADGIDVHYLGNEFLNRPPCWVMTISREATESDLEENHKLEEVGESIWMVAAEITHCPYCGEHLPVPDVEDHDLEVDLDETEHAGHDAFGAFSLLNM